MKGKNGKHRTYGGNNRGSCNTDILYMSDFKWCHGPTCHKDKTQDRIRGSKGSKVLRTRKIKQHTESSWYRPNDFMNYFCSNGCYNQFAHKHIERIVAIAHGTSLLKHRLMTLRKLHTKAITLIQTEHSTRGQVRK